MDYNINFKLPAGRLLYELINFSNGLELDEFITETKGLPTALVGYPNTSIELVSKLPNVSRQPITVTYSRIDLDVMFSYCGLQIDANLLDVDGMNYVPNNRFLEAINARYGVSFTVDDTLVVVESGKYYITARAGNLAYIGSAEVKVVQSTSANVNSGMATPVGYVSAFRSPNWVLVPLSAYPPGALLVTRDETYDPNLTMQGTWTKVSPGIATANLAWGAKCLAEPFTLFVGEPPLISPHFTFIKLSVDSAYNDGKIKQVSRTSALGNIVALEVTEERSPLKGRVFIPINTYKLFMRASDTYGTLELDSNKEHSHQTEV